MAPTRKAEVSRNRPITVIDIRMPILHSPRNSAGFVVTRLQTLRFSHRDEVKFFRNCAIDSDFMKFWPMVGDIRLSDSIKTDEHGKLVRCGVDCKRVR